MARETLWRDGEDRIVSVTPVALGLVRPSVLAVFDAAAIEVLAHYWGWMHSQARWALLIFVVPPLVLVATRTWRWRSHKIHVTNHRIVTEGGVARRYRQSVELSDVHAVRVEQGMRDRVIRRGTIYLETAAGTISLGRVRHPSALVRLIERERAPSNTDRPPLDTVFEYEDPAARGYDVDPRWRRQAR